MTSGSIIHFWDLKGNVFVFLNAKFKEELMKKFMKITKTKYNANKLTGISGTTIGRYKNKHNNRFRIDFLLKIVDIINDSKFSQEYVEKNITWIGDPNSQGIIKPKLPFNFNSRSGARFLAAICNEGWISDGLYYSNSSKELRDSVKRDALSIFGGNDNTIRDWVKEKDQYLAFPSVMRDILNLITKFKGVKSENNPSIPSFILENRDLMFGWLEQTIADEGCVKYYPETYRREIAWKRSFNRNLNVFRLNRDELNMLCKLSINHHINVGGVYKTKKSIEKIRLQIRIAERKNLLRLRELIRIPDKKKDRTLTEITKSFVRYKEPLKIKNTIVKICKEIGHINNLELSKGMNYKNTNTAIKWLKLYKNKGLLKVVKEYSYDRGRRTPTIYFLNKKP